MQPLKSKTRRIALTLLLMVLTTATAWAETLDGVKYIDENGTEQTANGVTVLTGSETTIGTEGETTWYVCNTAIDTDHPNGLSYSSTLTLNGDVRLILADNCTMNIGTSESRINGNGIYYDTSGVLTIYGQSANSGTLSVYTTGEDHNGIVVSALTINGGYVIANTDGSYIAALFANGANGITINGGIVEATATGNGSNPIYASGGYFNYNGGIVTTVSNSSSDAIYASNGHYNFSWRNVSDRITIASTGLYTAAGTATVTFANGQCFTDGTDIYRGELKGNAIDALKGKTLTPYGYGGYCGKSSENGGKNVIWEIPLVDHDGDATTPKQLSNTLTISKNPAITDTNADFSMADYENNDASVAGNFAPWIQPDSDGNSSDGLKYPVTAVTIGDGVTTVGQKAFDYCGDLNTVSLGNVTTIGEKAFFCCDDLTAVTIPNSVGTIGDYAFSSCERLTTVTIGSGVTQICTGAFSDCLALTTVTFERYVDGGSPAVTQLGGGEFANCPALKAIFVPNQDAYDAYYNGNHLRDYQSLLAPQTITLAKNGSGWGTYCHSYPVSYTLSEGTTAYTVTGLSTDGTSVTTGLATVTIDNNPEDEDPGTTYNVAAPRTPLLLNYTGTDDITLTALPATVIALGSTDAIVSTTGTGWGFYGNASNEDLGADACNFITAGTGGTTSYVLRNGLFVLVDTNSGLPAHRCLLNVSGSSGARTLSIGGTATGVATMDNGKWIMDDWYSLDGRKLNQQPTAPGVYIKGGRKVVITL